ncbi:MAG: hypothetical protein R6V60_09800 [Desulfobacterales bacterium]
MGIIKKFLKGAKGTKVPLMTTERAEKIIQTYGPVLEEKSKKPMHIADESKLPYPKDQIKKAIIYALLYEKDLKQKDALEGGYIELAMWQKGVGEKDALYGFDPSVINLVCSPEKIVETLKDIEAEMDVNWIPVILQERRALRRELEQLGFGQTLSADFQSKKNPPPED